MGAPSDEHLHPAAPDKGWLLNARPQHREIVPDFEIGKYEVTAKEFCEFLNDVAGQGESADQYLLINEWSTIVKTGSEYRPRTDSVYSPATHIQYFGARRYCEWLSRVTGDAYRLPSEVEWEYTTRGASGRTYPWGESTFLRKGYFQANYGPKQPTDTGVITVGMFPEGATPEGVHDLIGNASEWCCNYFDEYSEKSITLDPAAYKKYVNLEDIERLHPQFAGVPCAATRGHQYITRTSVDWVVSTGWVRIGRPIYNPPSFTYKDTGRGFRVLRELK